MSESSTKLRNKIRLLVNEELFRISSEWDCESELNPPKKCIYSQFKGPNCSEEECIFCGEPEDRQ